MRMMDIKYDEIVYNFHIIEKSIYYFFDKKLHFHEIWYSNALMLIGEKT